MQLSDESAQDFGQYNKLNLRFRDKELESRYLQQTEPFRLLQLRWAVFIVGFLYCVFSVIDQIVLPQEVSSIASRLHLTQGLLFCIAIAVSFRFKSVTFLYLITFLANSLSWFSHFFIVIVGGVSLYFVEAYFMLLWVWVASGFTFTLSVKFNLFFISVLVLVMQGMANFANDIMTVHYLFVFVSVVLGGFGGYLVEYYKRQSFLSYELVEKARLQAEQANRTKDKFFSIISHDLRGPVGSISVILNSVAKQGSDLTDDLYLMLSSASKNAYSLLENLLTWARSQNGELECKPGNILMTDSIESSLDLYRSAAQQKNISVSVDIEAGLYAYADLQMVDTIIRNLINNAIKFTHQQGHLWITAHKDGRQVRVRVADDGMGMTDEVMQSLFEIDKKVYLSVGTSSESGSGMGLRLCADFVHRNAGTISVESEEGRGSQFEFTLPLGSVESKQQDMVERIKGWNVLVVEDNPLHQTTTQQALQDMGLIVSIASNAQAAVKIALAKQPELILMDFELPDFNGDIATQQILELSANPPQHIIALTSYSRHELERKLARSPFDGYLQKPLKQNELLDCLFKA
ncbi:MAG: hybrid sensor histidine kinase/response regulator [Gammaproteobacteria bacterium]|nr:hybrid sensor histidine kinase/response regulator [Gammaproteobacteria bacterium]